MTLRLHPNQSSTRPLELHPRRPAAAATASSWYAACAHAYFAHFDSRNPLQVAIVVPIAVVAGAVAALTIFMLRRRKRTRYALRTHLPCINLTHSGAIGKFGSCASSFHSSSGDDPDLPLHSAGVSASWQGPVRDCACGFAMLLQHLNAPHVHLQVPTSTSHAPTSTSSLYRATARRTSTASHPSPEAA